MSEDTAFNNWPLYRTIKFYCSGDVADWWESGYFGSYKSTPHRLHCVDLPPIQTKAITQRLKTDERIWDALLHYFILVTIIRMTWRASADMVMHVGDNPKVFSTEQMRATVGQLLSAQRALELGIIALSNDSTVGVVLSGRTAIEALEYCVKFIDDDSIACSAIREDLNFANIHGKHLNRKRMKSQRRKLLKEYFHEEDREIEWSVGAYDEFMSAASAHVHPDPINGLDEIFWSGILSYGTVDDQDEEWRFLRTPREPRILSAICYLIGHPLRYVVSRVVAEVSMLPEVKTSVARYYLPGIASSRNILADSMNWVLWDEQVSSGTHQT